MIRINVNTRALNQLKTTKSQLNGWTKSGFTKMMNTLSAFSKTKHNWKNRTHNTKSMMRMKINRNGTSGKIYNDSEVSGFLHYGTKRHWVEPRRKKALSWVSGRSAKFGASDGKRKFSMGHWVSGIKAEPWVEDIWNTREDRFLGMIEKSIFNGMNKKWS